jgi:hypothetical protein
MNEFPIAVIMPNITPNVPIIVSPQTHKPAAPGFPEDLCVRPEGDSPSRENSERPQLAAAFNDPILAD